MVYRNCALLTSAPMKLAAALLLCLSTATFAFGQNPIKPVLVPYTVNVIAGNAQSTLGGYGGDGVPGTAATLNAPEAVAVDTVGNVYIADTSNALIREVNAQTGIIKIIAGVAPSGCVGTASCKISSACPDGVLAAGNSTTSKILGLVVDGFGNVYFSDNNDQGVWVIYRGGTPVANFINLVDSAGVTTAGGVLAGYVYHVAGTATFKTGGCTSTASAIDKVLATKATLHSPGNIGLDAAGNIYVQDLNNSVVRVINTQATTQTFFGVSVQPGFIASIVNCNATLTQACPGTASPFGGPAGASKYDHLSAMSVDQYGNVYQLNGSGATGSIYGAAAYAGGSALANLIYLESGLTATPGGWYEVINSITSSNAGGSKQAVLANAENNLVLRPVSIATDPLGNLYMQDYHWINLFRVDVNSQMATRVFGTASASGTPAAPAYCAGTTGPQTIDKYGDGCPVTQAKLSSSAGGYVAFDSVGNLYEVDYGNQIIRKVSVNTQFPSTAMGATLTQTIQVHFDASNLPITTGTTPFPTTSFKIGSGNGDFTIAGTPTCSNYTTGLDASLECYVQVTFSPAAPGTRRGALQATTSGGGVYNFALTGSGSGTQIAVDGGTQTVLATTGLGKAAGVAVGPTGTVYIADPTNNQVVVEPAGGGAQTTVGSGLSAPMGVAVDPDGNVYISDTGHNRVVEVNSLSGTQSVLTTIVNAPQGLAVDSIGNVYVADTGNRQIVEINPWAELGAAPLFAFSGGQTFVSPVAVAVDSSGNVYVADSGNSTGIIKITAGGGDLQVPSGGTSVPSAATVIGFGTAPINSPSGIAIDAAGDLYVSDNSSNIVEEIPSATGPGSEPFALGFTGLSSPAGVAIDSSGNVYVADPGNSRVVEENRSQLAVNFGTVSLYQTPGTVPLKVTNIGTVPLAPAVPFTALTGANPGDYGETDGCGASNFPLGTIAAGLHCNLTPSFSPTLSGTRTATMSVQNGTASISLTGVGQPPQAVLTIAAAAPGGLVAGQTATVTLTATQPNGVKNTPSGTITFTYTVNGVAGSAVAPATLAANGTASFQLPTLLLGRNYVVNASYSGDSLDSATVASPLTFYVPGNPVTVTANSLTYVYGGTVPTPTGTVTGILPADQATVKAVFSTTATPSSPVGTYPITVTFSGGNYLNYGFPTVYNADGKTPAVVTETPAPLSVTVNNATASYGSANLTFTSVTTGLVNGDVPTVTFTPAQSQTIDVGAYSIVPTVSIPVKGSTYDKINNYSLKITDGTLTITQAPSAVTIAAPVTTVLPSALAGADGVVWDTDGYGDDQ
jgi:sugar lactone lactonase YvrE